MKYKITQSLNGGISGPRQQFKVVEIDIAGPVPDNAERVDDDTPLSDWADVSPLPHPDTSKLSIGG